MAKFSQLNINEKRNLRKKVLKLMHKRARPTLVGEIALELRCSLELAHDLLDEMSDAGTDALLVDPNSSVEEEAVVAQVVSTGEQVAAFRLTVKPSLKVAHGHDEIRGPKPFQSRPPSDG